MKKNLKIAIAITALGVFAANANENCTALSQTVLSEVKTDKSNVLEIVANKIAASPGCACEVVKAAIKGSEADSKMVAAIVETAANASPEQLNVICQSAIAAAPDAAADIQAVLVKLDPNQESQSPLDFPGEGDVGPLPGTDGGNSILIPGPQFDTPPSIDPPVVTDPNPSSPTA
jgi:hypothetical protein